MVKYRNVEFIELPVFMGKTEIAIETVLNEAVSKKVLFIFFEDSYENIQKRFFAKFDKFAKNEDEKNTIGRNITIRRFDHPIDIKTLDKVVEESMSSLVVIDSLDWIEPDILKPIDREKYFAKHANGKSVHFIATKQAPRYI